MNPTRCFALAAALASLGAPIALRAAETAAPAAHETAAGHTAGRVKEVHEAGRYTYVRVATDLGEDIWAASTRFDVAVGDRVTVPLGMPMKDFTSRELKRTFDWVYFAGHIAVGGAGDGAAVALPPGHPPIARDAAAEPAVDFTGLARAANGYTVAGIYSNAAALHGQTVRVRGKVVKVNPQIMDRNWVHLRDGTGVAPSDDLLVTTAATVEPGRTVLVSGTLATNVDYGSGYRYPLVIEQADLTVE